MSCCSKVKNFFRCCLGASETFLCQCRVSRFVLYLRPHCAVRGAFYDNEMFEFGQKMLEDMQKKGGSEWESFWDEQIEEMGLWAWRNYAGEPSHQKRYYQLLKIFACVLEFQESQVSERGGPDRVRLRDWNVKIEEMGLGERTFFPIHLPGHWNMLVQIVISKMHPRGETILCTIDFEGDSSSKNLDGTLVNTVWNLDPRWESRLQDMYSTMGLSHVIETRRNALRDLYRVCFLNRADVIWIEDGSTFLTDPCHYEATNTSSINSRQRKHPLQHIEHKLNSDDGKEYAVPMGAGMYIFNNSTGHGGDLGTMLMQFSHEPSDYVCTITWPSTESEEQYIKKEFKGINHRSAYYEAMKTNGRLRPEAKCTLLICRNQSTKQ